MATTAKDAREARSSIKEEGIIVAFTRPPISQAFDPVLGAAAEPAPGDPPASVLEWNADAVVLPATLARFRGVDSKLAEDSNLVLTKARLLLCAAVDATGATLPEPQPEDRVAFHGATWKVAGCSALKPAETALLYNVAVLLT